MKKLLIVAILVVFAAAPAFAGEPADVYTYSGKGTTTFNHKAHSEKLGCAACHEGTPAKIEIIENDMVKGKETGHAACLDCHKKMKGDGAPTKCSDCHVK
jgi:c(7)-type cytochrome triheme protein